ncbi:MAG: D-2-hydroxyacid dehydrogenase [Pseudomonadales bacterium]|nr:D-2-hydroxyacid dehydrogenase [Pseudomonadales bacterium]
MENLLLAEGAIRRLGNKLDPFKDRIRLLSMGKDGTVTLDDQPVSLDDVPVHLAWFSQELLATGTVGQFSKALLSATELRWLQTITAGLDHPMFRRLLENGVRMSNSDAQAPAIAEYVLGAVLHRYQQFSQREKFQQNHQWESVGFRQLCGSQWLIIGFGNIGQRVGRMARSFEAVVTGVKRSAGSHPDADAIIAFPQLAEHIGAADVIVLSCALTEQTADLVDEAFLAAVKPGTVLVNIARGGVVDEDALLHALSSERLDYAILDVFKEEPLPAESPFWDHPRVHLTPHASNRGNMTLPRGEALFLENLQAWLTGAPLRNEVDLGFFSP